MIVLRAMEVLVFICDKKIREILFKKKTPDEMIIKKRIDSVKYNVVVEDRNLRGWASNHLLFLKPIFSIASVNSGHLSNYGTDDDYVFIPR